jgi:hypothetical protein
MMGPVFLPATAMGGGGGGIPPPPDSTGEGDSFDELGSPIVIDDPEPGVEAVLRACLNALSGLL